jgi:Fe-S-cluster containining protein
VPAPLIIRPGTRYECHGDGTCCTSIHQLGPLTQAEAARIRAAATLVFPDRKQTAAYWHEGIKGLVIAADDQRCMFLDDHARCLLHARVGVAAKPAACRQFPLGTTATAGGVRVTLSHRCPCVSVGDSPLLDDKRARSILASPGSGRVIPTSRVGERVRVRGKRTIDFHAYAAWEKPMLARLDGDQGESIESILGVNNTSRLPKLKGTSWNDVTRRLAHYAQGEERGDGFFSVVRWVEHSLHAGASHPPPRPWAWTFERTGARAVRASPLRPMYGSWLADELWSMVWAVDMSLYRALADMAARYQIAQRVAARLEQAGTRPDLAAAEGIMIVDVLGASEPWGRVVQSMEEPAAGAFD